MAKPLSLGKAGSLPTKYESAPALVERNVWKPEAKVGLKATGP
jgi:hypothetical protein